MSGTMKPRASVAIAAVVSALVFVSIGGAAPPGTQTQAAEVAACAALYGVPAAAAPDPLASCQWDMRVIGATPSGSYAVNQGQGARVGDIDTGIDLDNTDIMPNVDLAASCVFLRPPAPSIGVKLAPRKLATTTLARRLKAAASGPPLRRRPGP